MIKTPRQWVKTLKVKCEIHDPDGWDRTNFRKDFRRKITALDFFDKMNSSTCIHNKNKKDMDCSCGMLQKKLKDNPKV